ncbi:transposase [Bacteroidales bacterium 6E]|nr:transposase [Bacteroidales bacterium 6E]
MGTKKTQIKSFRVFSEEFKKSRVHDYESGKFTVSEVGRLFGISHQLLYRWIYKYSTYNKKRVKIVEMNESSTKKLKDMELRIRELEQVIGQKQLKIDYLEKMIELASKELDIDIKKNSGTLPSNGFSKTSKK